MIEPVLVLVAVVVAFGAWSLLAVIRTPAYALWKPGVAATEWGHWLAIIVLLQLPLLVYVDAPAWALATALVSAGLFLTPVARAVPMASRIPPLFDRAFPSSRSQDGDYGPEGRIVPLSLARIFHIPIPAVEPVTLEYAPGARQPLLLDLYRPVSGLPGAAPLVVFVHAGSWRSGDRRELTGLNRCLASRGIGVAAIDYRLAPEHRFPAAVEDVARAVGFLASIAREHGCAPDRIVLAGRSAGGHLALSAAYRHDVGSRVRGVIGLYAPTDLCWSWQRPSPRRLMDSNGAIRDFLGGTLEEIPEAFEAASPLAQVSARCPPTLLVHGGKDELVSPLQSSRLGEALTEAGVLHLHIELPWGKHAMEANLAGPSGQITTYLIDRFVRTVTAY